MAAEIPEFVDGPVDEPLQLVEFVRTEGNDQTEIKLKYENLDRILKPCGDRPLSILTVCGPSRMGKSFLLGYMIRCLEALEKEESDWMDWSNKTKPLTGFKFRTGTKPETQGIWVWSRPFNIKTEEGQEVSVLLVDTQGTQDEFTTTKDMSAIVGLSLLASSVLIFNFFTNLQEDILVALNTYIQYGMLALEHLEEGQAPFQKLIFLIRDWNNPSEFPCGEKGGKKFLDEKLQVKPDQPKEAKQLRETIRKCFQNLDCFLMPHIGDKALYADFKGSVSELNNGFAQKLEQFISGLINVEDIIVKEMLGDKLNASDFRSYLEMFIETFNSEDTPTPTNMMEAASKVHNNIQVTKACRKYEDNLKKKIRGKKYLTEEDMGNAHSIALKSAKEALKKGKMIGDTKEVEERMNELERLIQEKFEQAKQQNAEKRKNYITDSRSDAMTAFREQLEQEFPLTADNETEFYEEKDMKKAGNRMKSEVVEEFREKLSDEGEEELQKLETILGQLLHSSFETHLEKNKTHRLCAEKEMNTIVKNLVEEYKTKMGDHINVNKFEDFEKIQEFHDDLKKGSIESFEDLKKPGGKEFQKTFAEELVKHIEEAFDSIRDKVKLELKDIQEKADQYVSDECGRYLADLKAVIDEEDCLEVEVLEKMHYDNKEEFMASFDASQYYPSDTRQHNDLMKKVEEELEKAYEQVRSELENILEKSKESNQKAMEESIQQYKDEMKQFLEGADGYLDDDKIEEAHERVKEDSLKIFRESPKVGPIAKNKEILEMSMTDLSSTLDDLLETVKSDNVTRRETAKLKATNLVNDCRSEYVKIMKRETEEVVRTEHDLTAAHERAKATVFDKFKDEVPIKSPEFMESYLETLEEEIEETFEEYVELFELKKSEDDTKMKGLLLDCRQQYLLEMEKQCNSEIFVRPDRLDNLHDHTKQVVLRKLKSQSNGGITKVQEDDILEEMDNQFEAYKMKNDMKLNSEKYLGVAPAIGIDLGTTYCCVGVYYQGKVIIVPNQDQGGNLTTPSYVAYNTDGSGKDVVVGEPAKENAYKNAENTIYDAKRIIGRKMNDPDLQSDIKMWPFTVKEDAGIPKILANGKLLYPEQVSAKLLGHFKDMTEKYLKLEPGTITKAVITVPAYFNDGQRQATVDAGKLAGLDVLTILNEPTAAAIAYSLERLETTAKKVLVYDLGGGTFDVAVLNMMPKEIEVLGVEGDTHLGGEDFDKNMMTFCAQKFKEKSGIDLFDGKDSPDKVKRDEARRRLRRVQTYCEKAKKQLATARSAKVTIDAIANGLDMDVEVTREKFEELNDKEFRKTIEIVERALKSKTVMLRKEDIDDIVLVGGSSRILKVQELLKTFFGDKALNHTIHPDHCVAYGAAVKAAMMNGEQAKGNIDFSKIQDVTPLSLGIEVVGGWMSTIIPKNTKIPCKLARPYYTARHNQTTACYEIFQGEERVAKDNEHLGEFVLKGIPPGRSGQYPLETSMEINSMGILHVTAVCEASGSTNSITITENKMRMSEETIDRLLAESG